MIDSDTIKNIDFNDGKKRVLILGNGESRLHHSDIYKYWGSEIWGCNWVYKEYLNGNLPRLDALIGDHVCLKQAIKEKKIFNDVVIYGKSNKSLEMGSFIKYPDAGNIYSDSGSTFVKHAIKNGYDEIYLMGFDLGGADIYQHRHHLRNKKSWVDNWRKIAKDYTLNKIFFIGYDHKDFILSDLPSDSYAKFYLRGKDHLKGYYNNKEIDPLYAEAMGVQNNIKKDEKVLILGNGKSRNHVNSVRFIKTFKGEIWGCNDIYKQYKEIPHLDRIGVQYNSVLDNVSLKIINNHIDSDIKIYTNKIVEEKYPLNINVFQDNRDYFTGPHMVLQALYERYDNIYIVGFDMGGVDVWDRKMKYSKELKNQMRTIIQEQGLHRFNFVGGIPKFIL